MKTVEEIALEAAVDYLKFKLGDRKGFNVYDIDEYDADELIAEIEQECAKSFMDFLAAVDAERGKDAVCHLYRDMYSGGKNGVLKVCRVTPSDDAFPVFLSPTIPLGFALVPIDPSEEWIAKVVRVNQPDLDIGCRAWREEVESLEYWHKAITKAAGVTK